MSDVVLVPLLPPLALTCWDMDREPLRASCVTWSQNFGCGSFGDRGVGGWGLRSVSGSVASHEFSIRLGSEEFEALGSLSCLLKPC